MVDIARLRCKRRLSVDDALEILSAAAQAEENPDLQRLYSAAQSPQHIGAWLGTLRERLALLGVTPEMLRRIGAAFEREEMEHDARAYITEISEQIPYDSELCVTDTEGLPQVIRLRHDIAEAWITRSPMRKRGTRRSASCRRPIRLGVPQPTDCPCAICEKLRAPKALGVVELVLPSVEVAQVHLDNIAESLTKKRQKSAVR